MRYIVYEDVCQCGHDPDAENGHHKTVAGDCHIVDPKTRLECKCRTFRALHLLAPEEDEPVAALND